MKYLFQVSIGPVQAFIASARRTRDLSFGSWLLSELAKAAARQIMKVEGLDSLIFPAPEQEKMLDFRTELNVANKIVALVQHSPQVLGPLVHNAVLQQLDDIKKEAYKKITLSDREQENANAQIADLVEFQWVALLYEEDKYVAIRQQLESMMAARKNTRDFDPVTWESNQPKSSIDGQLESVIPEGEYPSRRATDTDKRERIRHLYEHYGAGPAERLSGVDLLKRHGTTTSDSHFPSTSHMATLPFLKRLEALKSRKQVIDAWNTYISILKSLAISPQLEQIPDRYPSHPILGRYEGSLLLEDRLVDVLYVPASDPTNNANLQKAKKVLSGFYEEIDTQFAALGLSKARPNPYYAILLADGDRMGAVIDEQAKRKIAEGEHGYEQHRLISQALGRFAGNVDAIVKQHQGALVYAGGDDVLAFVPLHTVLQCARKLADSFKKELKDFVDDKGNTPTLSVGVAIIHHLDSLQDALKLVRDAEQKAKQVDDKNALAIIVSKRSGEDYSIARQWDDIDFYLKQLITLCQAHDIPAGTAYELRDLARRLTVPASQSNFEMLQNAIQADVVRILRRKLYVPQGKLPKGKAEDVEKVLKSRIGIEQENTSERKIRPVSIEEFTNELIIAQVLADAMQLADPKKEQNNDNLDH